MLLKAQQNDQILSKVVEGLTQVIESVRNPVTRFRYGENQQVRTSISKKCWLHKTDNHDITICSAFQSMANKIK